MDDKDVLLLHVGHARVVEAVAPKDLARKVGGADLGEKGIMQYSMFTALLINYEYDSLCK